MLSAKTMVFTFWIALTAAAECIGAPIDLTTLSFPPGPILSCPDDAIMLPVCDYSPGLDMNSFFMTGSVQASGSAISAGPGGPAVSSIAITGPAPIAVPAAFRPPIPVAGFMWLVSSGGNASITATHIVMGPPGGYRMATGITGFAYFPNAGSDAFGLTLSNRAGPCADSFTVGGVNPGTAGSIVNFAFARVVQCGNFGGGSITHQATLDVNIIGTAAIFLPMSADYLVQVIPEPGALSLTGLGIGLLAARAYRRQIKI